MPLRTTAVWPSLVLLLLAGCAQQGGPAPSAAMPAPAAPAGMAMPAAAQAMAASGATAAAASGTIPCPAANVSAMRSDGSTVHYQGANPSDPNVCVFTVNGTPAQALFSIFGVPKSMPPGIVANARTAIATALAGPPGTQASFTTPMLDNGFTAENSKVQWNVTCVNQGVDPVTVGGTSYPAIKLQRDTQVTEVGRMAAYHSQSTSWIDPKSGVVLKYEYHVIAGPVPSIPSWTATSVTL